MVDTSHPTAIWSVVAAAVARSSARSRSRSLVTTNQPPGKVRQVKPPSNQSPAGASGTGSSPSALRTFSCGAPCTPIQAALMACPPSPRILRTCARGRRAKRECRIDINSRADVQNKKRTLDPSYLRAAALWAKTRVTSAMFSVPQVQRGTRAWARLRPSGVRL